MVTTKELYSYFNIAPPKETQNPFYTMSLSDLEKYGSNKSASEAHYSNTGMWDDGLRAQNDAIRSQYGIGNDTLKAADIWDIYNKRINAETAQAYTANPAYTANAYSSPNGYDTALYEAEQSAADTLQAQSDQLIRELQALRSGIYGDAEQQARQAYINKETSLNSLSDYLRSAGLSGGVAESVRIGADARYGEQHNRILGDRDARLLDNEYEQTKAQSEALRDISALRNEYALRRAELADKLGQQAADRAYKEQQQSLSWAREDSQRTEDRQYKAEQLAAEVERQNFLKTIGAYSANYMKRIQELENDGDTSNDWQIPYLTDARNQKIAVQEAEQKLREQQQAKTQLDQQLQAAKDAAALERARLQYGWRYEDTAKTGTAASDRTGNSAAASSPNTSAVSGISILYGTTPVPAEAVADMIMRGELSYEQLQAMIASGSIRSYTVNGKTYFAKS